MSALEFRSKATYREKHFELSPGSVYDVGLQKGWLDGIAGYWFRVYPHGSRPHEAIVEGFERGTVGVIRARLATYFDGILP